MSKKKNIEEIRASRSRKAKLERVSRDTSERKQTEQLIEQLAKFPGENPYPMLRVSDEGKVLYANQASKPLLVAKNSGEGALAPADWRLAAEEAMKSGSVIRIEAEHNNKTFAFRIAPVVNAGYCNFYGADITERKNIEQQLKDASNLNQIIIDASPVGIWIFEESGQFVMFNSSGVALSGGKAEQLLKLNFWELESWKKSGLLQAAEEALLTGKLVKKEIHTVNTFNAEVWYEALLSIIQFKGKRHLLLMTYDIKDRKHSEEALRETTQTLEALIQASPLPIVALDRERIVKTWNPAAERTFGWSAKEVIGRRYPAIPKEKMNEADALFQRALESGLTEVETLRQRKDGSLFDISISAAPLRDSRGNINGTMAVIADVTERKQAEKKLLDYQAQLKSLASELTLTEERERRRIAVELHDQIAQSLVISKIKLDTLRSSAPSQDLAKELNEISDSFYQIVQDIRSLTFDLGFPVLYELGLETAVAAWLVEQIQEKYGIASEFEDDEQPKPLDDDVRVLLFRDVRELLINVVKHASASKVKVSIRKVDGKIQVSVEDDGVGFDVAKVVSTSAKAGSFGLFSIKERLEESGGHLEIDSKPGYGTRVTLMAPLKQQNTKGGQK